MCSYMSGILITIILIARLSVSPPLINYATMHTGKRKWGGAGGRRGKKHRISGVAPDVPGGHVRRLQTFGRPP